MIELPESQTLARQISATLTGKRIQTVTANQSPHKFAWFTGDPQAYNNLLAGKQVISASASGGMVEIQVEEIRLVFCDGTNVRYIIPGDLLPQKHQLHVIFDDLSALVCSVQMYGALWALGPGQTEGYLEIARCKPNPLTSAFDWHYFRSLYAESDGKLSAKAFLATRQRIPGLGNGVMQDILFNARLHPKRKMNSLADHEWALLFNAVKNTLMDMSAQGGRDTEKDLFGQYGGYQTILSVRTAGKACPVCGGVIRTEAYLGGRIYFCSECQTLQQ